MRKLLKRKEVKKVDEEEQILKAREALLVSAQEEERRLEHLRFLQKETQELLDKQADEEKHLSNRLGSLGERVAQLETREKELVGSINQKTDVERALTTQIAYLDETFDKTTASLTDSKKELAKVEDKLEATQFKEGAVYGDYLQHEAALKAKQEALQEATGRLTSVETKILEQRDVLSELEKKTAKEKDAVERLIARLVAEAGEKQTELQNLTTQIKDAEKVLDKTEDDLAKVEKKKEKELAELAAKHKELDIRSETLMAVAEELRVQANKTKAKELDKKIKDFLK